MLSRAFACADYLNVSFFAVNVGKLDDNEVALSACNVAFLVVREFEENAVVILINVVVVCIKTLRPENELCVDLGISLDHTLVIAPCAIAVVAGLHDVTLHIVAVHICKYLVIANGAGEGAISYRKLNGGDYTPLGIRKMYLLQSLKNF